MAKYRKKPVVTEAFQMTQDHSRTTKDWPEWLCEAADRANGAPGSIWWTVLDDCFMIGTLEGAHKVTVDDWIIQGVVGEIYPCKPDIFEATYYPVE